jgi:hypothetical protein
MMIQHLEPRHPRIQGAVQDAGETRRVIAASVEKAARRIAWVAMVPHPGAQDYTSKRLERSSQRFQLRRRRPHLAIGSRFWPQDNVPDRRRPGSHQNVNWRVPAQRAIRMPQPLLSALLTIPLEEPRAQVLQESQATLGQRHGCYLAELPANDRPLAYPYSAGELRLAESVPDPQIPDISPFTNLCHCGPPFDNGMTPVTPIMPLAKENRPGFPPHCPFLG